MNIVLIGYRGSGKSAVGKELSNRLGWSFVDTDALIEESAGMTIREIFAQRGEPGFRDLESQVIAKVAFRHRHVISLGGGAILRSQNVSTLKPSGHFVWLTAPPEILWERINADMATRSTRPDLTATGGLEEVRQMLSQRTPLYQAAADLEVDTAATPVPKVTDLILQGLALPIRRI